MNLLGFVTLVVSNTAPGTKMMAPTSALKTCAPPIITAPVASVVLPISVLQNLETTAT